MISKYKLINIFNQLDAYEIPNNYNNTYINDILSIGQLYSLNKDNIEYSWCHYIGNLGCFRYKQSNLQYNDVNINLDDISDIYECDETINYSKIHECLGLTFIPNELSTIPLYSLIGYDSINNCWLIFVNDNKEPNENTRPSYYYKNLMII
jgi:hypothetical protein